MSSLATGCGSSSSQVVFKGVNGRREVVSPCRQWFLAAAGRKLSDFKSEWQGNTPQAKASSGSLPPKAKTSCSFYTIPQAKDLGDSLRKCRSWWRFCLLLSRRTGVTHMELPFTLTFQELCAHCASPSSRL